MFVVDETNNDEEEAGDGMVRQISNDNENRGTFDHNLITLPLSIFFQKRRMWGGVMVII